MSFNDNYNLWLESDAVDNCTKNELKAIAGNDKDIEDRFYKDLSFGTGGLRGVMGAGTNRMNVYTVRKATQGVANEILSHGTEFAEKGVVIAYDSRNNSKEFAYECTRVLSANGIKTYIFDSLRPTPELSFAVRPSGTEPKIKFYFGACGNSKADAQNELNQMMTSVDAVVGCNVVCEQL